MLRTRSLCLFLITAALPLAVAGCGSDEPSSAPGNVEQEIRAAIELAATSGDPAACTEAQTQRFTEQTSGGTGEESIKSCERDAAQGVADSVEVSNIQVNGESATAEVAITGSPLDGQTIELALVTEVGKWKLDEALSFVVFDRDALNAGVQQQVQQAGEFPAAASKCLIQGFQELSDEQAQGLFLNPDEPAIRELFTSCLRGQ